MKLQIIKVTADGEQVSIEWPVPQEYIKMHQSGKMHLRDAMAPAFDVLDARLLEMNKRIMAGNHLMKKLSVDAQQAVTNVLDVLHGKSQGPAVDHILEEAKAESEAARAKHEAERDEATGASPLQGSKRPVRGTKAEIDALLSEVSGGVE